MTIKEARKIKVEDLSKEIKLQTKNLYEVMIKVKTGEEKNSSLIKAKKKEIARLKTIQQENNNIETKIETDAAKEQKEVKGDTNE